MQAVGAFRRIKNKLPYVADVTLTIDVSSKAFQVEFTCNGEGWIAQGYIEEVPANGYDDWKAGAAAGAKFACEQAGIPNAKVVVERIRGMITDTNPTIVAAAAAMAVWKAFDFEPAPEAITLIESSVFASWGSPEEIPDWSGARR